MVGHGTIHRKRNPLKRTGCRAYLFEQRVPLSSILNHAPRLDFSGPPSSGDIGKLARELRLETSFLVEESLRRGAVGGWNLTKPDSGGYSELCLETLYSCTLTLLDFPELRGSDLLPPVQLVGEYGFAPQSSQKGAEEMGEMGVSCFCSKEETGVQVRAEEQVKIRWEWDKFDACRPALRLRRLLGILRLGTICCHN